FSRGRLSHARTDVLTRGGICTPRANALEADFLPRDIVKTQPKGLTNNSHLPNCYERTTLIQVNGRAAPHDGASRAQYVPFGLPRGLALRADLSNRAVSAAPDRDQALTRRPCTVRGTRPLSGKQDGAHPYPTQLQTQPGAARPGSPRASTRAPSPRPSPPRRIPSHRKARRQAPTGVDVPDFE